MSSNKQISKFIDYAIGVVNVMAIIGSVLSIAIFSRKRFKGKSIGMYCKTLALFDLYVIFVLGVRISSFGLNSRSLTVYFDWLCKASSYIAAAFSTMSGWVLVVFSLDQLITVSMTPRFLSFKTKWLQYSLVIGIFTFHCVIYIPEIFLSGIMNITDIENLNATDFTCGNFSIVIPVIFLFESILLPFIILSILTFLMLRILVKSRSRVFSERYSFAVEKITRQRRASDFKYAFNSAILNIIHILFSSPLILYYIIQKSSQIFRNSAFLFFFSNFALHFWVHLCVNSVFRREFLILLRLKRNF